MHIYKQNNQNKTTAYSLKLKNKAVTIKKGKSIICVSSTFSKYGKLD